MRTKFASFIADGRLTLHAVALGGAEGEVVLSGDNAGGAASVLKDFIADDARRISTVDPPQRRTRDIYCYFDNDVKVKAPFDAQRLIAKVAAP